MAKILILGAGSMGIAFSFPCSDNGHSVSIVGTHLENDFIDQINSNRKHPSLNCSVPKNVNFLKFENLSKEINKKIDLIVVAVISKGIEWVSIELGKLLKNNVPILVDWEPCTVQLINSKRIIKSHSKSIAIKDRKNKKISSLTDKKGFLRLISKEAFNQLSDTNEMENLNCQELLGFC